MLKLTRGIEPECLRSGGPEWTDQWKRARERDAKSKFSWRNLTCYRRIRHVLCQDTGNRCAFCDGPVGLESRETVEHFQPKSIFPDLAYTWTNLFACCDKCQSNKKDSFDSALLKPDADDYDFADYFIANYQTGELEPAPNATEDRQSRAEFTIKLFGFNSEARKRARLREWKHYNSQSDPQIDEFSYRYFLALQP